MRNKTLGLLLILFYLPCSGQFPVAVDSVYTFIKYNSVLRNKIDWEKTDRSFSGSIASARTLNDTMNCFVQVLKELNDVHSAFIFNNRYYGHYNPVDSATISRIKPVMDRAAAVNGKVHTTILDKKFAYILVPAITAYNREQINYYGQLINDSICKYDPQKIKGFIIDLRLNGGGNMYPMLAGLNALLGNTVLGYETDIDGKVVRQWELQDNNFMIGGHQVTSIKRGCNMDYNKTPVVVLIGPVTGSSGSMTAIAFKQRPGSVFIGEPTADGYTTSNGYFQFAPNLSANFATNFVADRKKNIYKTTVDPDITVLLGDNFDDLLKDEKIRAALRWLEKNRK